MKNIHLLPTSQRSRLANRDSNNKLEVSEKNTLFVNGFGFTPHNIYITNNEKIKDGEYGLSKLGEIIKFHSGYDYRYYAKIILTTDQDLIKDGVQAIDDEFLEWFVKNPSCDEVETSLEETQYGNGIYEYVIYKRFIPKEEPKQDFPMQKLIDIMESDEELRHKQETLEENNEWSLEKAQQYALSKFERKDGAKQGLVLWDTIIEVLKVGVLAGHKFGVNWQKQQNKNMYNDEDVKK